MLAMAFPPSRTFLYLEHCGEAPKSAREGACAPQMEIGAFAECGRNFDEMTRRYETATSRASDAGEGATIRLVFAVAYCRRNFFT